MDYGFRGFFQLRDVNDLLAKLRRSYQRLVAAACDAYAAYEFSLLPIT